MKMIWKMHGNYSIFFFFCEAQSRVEFIGNRNNAKIELIEGNSYLEVTFEERERVARLPLSIILMMILIPYQGAVGNWPGRERSKEVGAAVHIVN